MTKIRELSNVVRSLTGAINRLCDILAAQALQESKPPRVEWHDTYHDDTPFSVLKGWSDFPARYRNAMIGAELVSFGELKKRKDMNMTNFGKKGVNTFKQLLADNGVLIEYFPVLN
jgi:hypothetical protein